MKRQIRNILVAALMMLPLCASAQRSVTLLDKDWRFSLGDKESAFMADYDDSSWERVVVPHDWAIYGPFDVNNDLQNVAVTQNFEKKASV